nr:methyltransferase domain-containing protein [Specibacter cremeus]
MRAQAVQALLCPVCGLDFRPPATDDRELACLDGHHFDIARQGYVNLMAGQGTRFQQDTPDMVEARDAFLDAGHYDRLADTLAESVATHLAGNTAEATGRTPLVVDAGTGTGFYLHRILAGLANEGHEAASIGLDISKFALRRAARRNPGTANLSCDVWHPLPIAARAADAVVVVFAPRNPGEFARILRPGGLLLVVTPLPGHLAELADGLLGIQQDKEAALHESLAGHFLLESQSELRYTLHLGPDDAANVTRMGPAGHHERRGAPHEGPVSVSAAFRISEFRPLPAQEPPNQEPPAQAGPARRPWQVPVRLRPASRHAG